MAAEVAMPAPQGDQHQCWQSMAPNRLLNRPRHHSRSLSYHPSAVPQLSPISVSDASSSQTVSMPPSPTACLAYHTRPIYIPAVLRPCDEFPSKNVVYPHSHGSASDSDLDSSPRRANPKIMGLATLASLSRRRGCSSPTDMASVIQGDWNLESFPEVTALPTRKHWKPDGQSSVCDDPTCKRNFSYFVRRHHCRKCGNIFCHWHSSFALPLDQDANFNPRAVLSRACSHCFREAKGLQGKLDGRASASGLDAPDTAPSTPISAMSGGATPTAPAGAEVAASIPRDWNWSTF